MPLRRTVISVPEPATMHKRLMPWVAVRGDQGFEWGNPTVPPVASVKMEEKDAVNRLSKKAEKAKAIA